MRNRVEEVLEGVLDGFVHDLPAVRDCVWDHIFSQLRERRERLRMHCGDCKNHRPGEIPDCAVINDERSIWSHNGICDRYERRRE